MSSEDHKYGKIVNLASLMYSQDVAGSENVAYPSMMMTNIMYIWNIQTKHFGFTIWICFNIWSVLKILETKN